MHISFTVFCCVLFVFSLLVRLRISPPRIKLAASDFARRFIGVQGRESPILVNFASTEAQNRMNRPVEMRRRKCHARDALFVKSCGLWT